MHNSITHKTEEGNTYQKVYNYKIIRHHGKIFFPLLISLGRAIYKLYKPKARITSFHWNIWTIHCECWCYMEKAEICPGFETFDADIKAARKARRLASKALAKMVGIKWQYLTNINIKDNSQSPGRNSAYQDLRASCVAIQSITLLSYLYHIIRNSILIEDRAPYAARYLPNYSTSRKYRIHLISSASSSWY